MTVTYSFDAVTNTWLGGIRILLRWKGSIWKIIFKEMTFWVLLYMMINVTINLCTTYHQDMFRIVRDSIKRGSPGLPHIFILGFFMNVVFNRWVGIFPKMGFVDHFGLVLVSAIKGSDAESRLLRRTIIRYTVLAQALVFRDISIPVRKRFPNLASLVDAGLMTDDELCVFEAKETENVNYWMPYQWGIRLIDKAFEDGIITNQIIAWNVATKMREFRDTLASIMCYDWVPVPIAYPQIVFIGVRVYLLALVIQRQQLAEDVELPVEGGYLAWLFHFPIMTFVETLLLVGWTKVAESMLNPFGSGDDDYECSYILDRNLSVGYTIVDNPVYPRPDEPDPFWHMAIPKPFDVFDPKSTLKQQPYHGSVADLHLRSRENPSFGGTLRRRSQMSRISVKSGNPENTVAGNMSMDGVKNGPPTPSTHRTRLASFTNDAIHNVRMNRLDSVTEEHSNGPKQDKTP
ncbi:unnamed protein product [Bursaphelenchus xylophilus]|uniref:Bestrophin homolog n=1 Tax=Bursaphelenchus xylophilus TaxID=6326 RepID=A0A1I7RJ54_BURXY|nr:unnamed protein product [Bursaphelenchus xylophilus]CAG9119367.1 unnamed protein product [Bursaphelenchus xylophilus]